MPFTIRRVDYFYATVRDEPGAAHRILSQLAGLGVNLLAFSAVPTGPERAQLARQRVTVRPARLHLAARGICVPVLASGRASVHAWERPARP